MIQRLENAGLGFYVKSTKTVHKLGNFTLCNYCSIMHGNQPSCLRAQVAIILVRNSC